MACYLTSVLSLPSISWTSLRARGYGGGRFRQRSAPRLASALCGALLGVLALCGVLAACSPTSSSGAATGGSSGSGGLILEVPAIMPDCVGGADDAPGASSMNAGGAASVEPGCVPSAERDYEADVAPVLSACHGEVCHGGAFLQRSQLSRLIGAPSAECCGTRLLIAPGHPERSYVLDKVRGTPVCGGERMPFDGPYLSDAQIQVLSDWICEGAPL